VVEHSISDFDRIVLCSEIIAHGNAAANKHKRGEREKRSTGDRACGMPQTLSEPTVAHREHFKPANQPVHCLPFAAFSQRAQSQRVARNRADGPLWCADRNGRTKPMTEAVVPHFHNDPGVAVIEIGAREFMCVGAIPPFDHPHVFCDMGDDAEYICPYCSTLYRHDPTLAPNAARPAECALTAASV